MTLVIAVKHKNGVVLGSDSQATLNRGVPLKKLNQVKLFELKNTRKNIVIGGAGAVPFISKTLEDIQENVNQNNNLTLANIVSIAESSILRVAKWYHTDRFQNAFSIPPKNNTKIQTVSEDLSEKDESKNDIKQHSTPQHFEIKTLDIILMIAGIDENDESQIYIVYPDGISEKQQTEAAIGSGAAYAEYILSQLICDDMTQDETLKIVIHVINEVTNIDPGVGGIPQAMNITLKGISRYEKKKIEGIIDKVEDVQDKVIAIWHKHIHEN